MYEPEVYWNISVCPFGLNLCLLQVQVANFATRSVVGTIVAPEISLSYKGWFVSGIKTVSLLQQWLL